jgi:hypothetical protein
VLAAWSKVQRWQWFTATGHKPADILPDTEDPALLSGTVHLSSEWRALALRQGLSFVGLTPWTTESVDFHHLARVYVRSVHLDVLLLGLLQLEAVHRYSDSLAALHQSGLQPRDLDTLESQFIELRSGIWWRDVAIRSRQTSDVLSAFQEQHRLPSLHAQIVEDLTDISRCVQARENSLRAAAAAAEETRRGQLDSAISLITFFLLPSALLLSAATLWGNPSPRLFVVSGLATLALTATLFLGRATLRSGLRKLGRD